MSSRLTLWALVVLSCATPAAAQLASQTALVGTVTDSGGAVVPGAQVVAVNTDTRDTYERRRLRRVLQHPVRPHRHL
jgi:hypothetical protein